MNVNKVICSHPNNPRFSSLLAAALVLLLSGVCAKAQLATNITGLYYTGLDSSGGLQAGCEEDANWSSVTYASTNGGASASSTYEGAAYVINAASVSGSAYTPNTSNAQWITAPGAMNSSGTSPNTGGDFLPGNGNTGSNEGIYVYTLAFNITGSGSGRHPSDQQYPDYDDPCSGRPVRRLRESCRKRCQRPHRNGFLHSHESMEQHHADRFAELRDDKHGQRLV